MKYLKIFMLMAATAMFVACSDDKDNWNSSGDAVVSMESQEIAWKENKGSNTPVNVPIVVTGERNGNIQVTVTVAETGDNPAMEDVHYIVTSKTIVIPADADAGSIELRTIDDLDINENRTFTMTISDVQGATIGSTASTLITLKDNDSEFYEKLMGGWKMVVEDIDTSTGEAEGTETWNVSIEGFDEGEDGYNQLLYLIGFEEESEPIEMSYEYDMDSQTGRIGFIFPSSFYAAYNFSGIGAHFLAACGFLPGSGWTYDPLYGTWNEDFTEITFETSPCVASRLYSYPDGAATGYIYGAYRVVKMTR